MVAKLAPFPLLMIEVQKDGGKTTLGLATTAPESADKQVAQMQHNIDAFSIG
jgi:hypothetical protein